MKNLITITFLFIAGLAFAQPVRTTITDDGVNVTVQTPVNIKVIPICDFHWVFVDGQLKMWIEGGNELIPGGRLGNFTINGATTQQAKLDALGAISAQCSGGGAGGTLTDGNKGDVTVSDSGSVWNINAGVIGSNEIANGGVGWVDLAQAVKDSIGYAGDTGIDYVTQTTAPTDTLKYWLDNSTGAKGVWPLKQRLRSAWRIVGWFDPVANFFSEKRPLYVLGTGQSNMLSVGSGDLSSDPRVLVGSGSTWAVAAPSDNNIAFQFSKNVAKNENRVVRYVVVAEGSKPVEDWYHNATKAVQIATAVQSLEIDSFDVILWRQGEQNATLGDSESTYAGKISTVFEAFRDSSWFGLKSPVLLGGLNESYIGTGPFNYFNKVNNSENTGTGFIGVNMLGLDRSNGIHIYGPSIDTVGYRYYQAYTGHAAQYSLNKTPYVSWISDRELAIQGGAAFPAFRAVESAQGRRGVYYKYDDTNNVGVLGLNGTVNGTTANDLDILFWDSEKLGLGGRNALLAQNRAILQLLPGRSFMPFSLRVATSAGISKFQLDTVGVFTKPIETFDQGAARGNIWLKHSSASAFESGRIRFTKNNNSATWIGSYIHNDGSANLFHIGTHSANDTLIANDINVMTFPRAGNGVGVKTTTISAYLTLAGGTATAATAPLKFLSGTLNTTAEAGAIEYDGNNWYYTNSTAVRGRLQVNRALVSSAGTLSLSSSYSDYVFTGTTTTWTLPTLASSSNVRWYIKNRGSGNITINTAALGNDIYTTSAVNTYSVTPGSAVIFFCDGTYFNVE